MRLWNGWGNEDSDLTMELSSGLRIVVGGSCWNWDCASSGNPE